jgi:hypothetical protein
MRRNRSSCFGGKRIGFATSAKILAGVFGIDFKEVVEDDQEHGGAAEEDGEGVELGVGDHGCCSRGLRVGSLVLVDESLGLIRCKSGDKVRRRVTFGIFG